MPTNTDRNGENSLEAAVELTAELKENTCFKICRQYSLHIDKLQGQSTSLFKKV